MSKSELTEEQARAYAEHGVRDAEEAIRSSGFRSNARALGNLDNWFTRMAKGNLIDERTPLFKNRSRPEVVREFTHKILTNKLFDRVTTVPDYGRVYCQVEASQAKNIGPMSVFKAWEYDGPDKVKAVMSDKPLTKAVKWDAYMQALDDVRHLLPPRSIRRSALEEAYRGMNGNPKFALDPTTNACFPYWVSGWNRPTPGKGGTESDRLRAEAQAFIYRQARALYAAAGRTSSYKSIAPYEVATASQRTVQKGPKPLESKKVKRIVLAMPKYTNTVPGKTIAQPLQLALSEVRNVDSGVRIIPAWSPMPTLDKNMQVMLEYAEAHGRTVLSGDISSFDATVPPQVMWDVCRAMSDWMEKDTATLFLAIAFGDIYQTAVLTPGGKVSACPSSVKSGSIFTSVEGCIINYFIQRYGYRAGYYRISQQTVMGDDFCLDGDGVTPDSVSAAFADFGMECHPDKQFCERCQLHFLQRTHSLGLPGGQGSVERVLGSLMSVEDDTQLHYDERNKFAYAFQALARLENANFNPEFETLVAFAALGDGELRLGAGFPADVIAGRAGEYARRKLSEATNKPWKSVSTGVPFRRWAVNRVLRGERLPPLGKDRFRAIYGISYDRVEM